MSVGMFMGYWDVSVASAPTLYLRYWNAAHTALGWELVGKGEGRVVMGVSVGWAWMDGEDETGKLWLWREGEIGE